MRISRITAFIAAALVSACFAAPARADKTLTVTPPPSGSGGGFFIPGEINCGDGGPSDCSEVYPDDTPVTLTRQTNGAMFTAWGGDCAGTDPSPGTCQMTMSVDRVASGTWSFSLNANLLSGQFGYISGAGIDCGASQTGPPHDSCQSILPVGTAVTLTAISDGWNLIPGTGSTFGGWSGQCYGLPPGCEGFGPGWPCQGMGELGNNSAYGGVGNTSTCRFALNGYKNVTAVFNLVIAPVETMITDSEIKSGKGKATIDFDGNFVTSRLGSSLLRARAQMSAAAGIGFQCKLDAKPYAPCTSPVTYRKLKSGRHTFSARAVNSAGVADSTPATKTFKVKRKKPKKRKSDKGGS
jgi:hypothetical protein